ncbi:alpha/beta fold hydrolase [Leifsonia sp. ZF2019]|uniref:alpha/beta fold hydrolase n=1 Tax=Leifsonia sp. ZF2019 TaxID=2781978 RepID=UPI001CBA71A7|nr:alpha/beta hydrolase [Leifsonia sp. ZF2019]
MIPNALHHEWHGDPDSPNPPLLLLHGGGSTIASNWGLLLPRLAPTRSVLAVELQGHGRTATGDGPASFERSADDVAALLATLHCGPVDVLGFSNGGQVALQLAGRYPAAVRRLIVASAPFRRSGMVEGFWEGLAAGTFDDLPAPYRRADLAVSGDPDHARRMFDLDRDLMLGFQDFPDELLDAVTATTLVVVADRDVVRVQEGVELASRLADARLLVVPGNHGDYLGEVLASGGDDAALRRTLPFLVAHLDAR